MHRSARNGGNAAAAFPGRVRPREASLRMADAVSRGLPKASLTGVKAALKLTDVEMSVALGVSAKSLSRLRKSGRRFLDPVASDRLYRYARLFELARDVLEDLLGAREWLRSPQVGLGDRVPLDLLRTEAGARIVEDLLGRIEHGVLP